MKHMNKDFRTLLQFAINWKKWQKILFCLSCVVVFVTTYALILPAITLEKQAAENEAGIILDTDDSLLPDGYDTSAPDNVQGSDSGIIDDQDANSFDDTDPNGIDDLFTDGANDPVNGDADETVNDGIDDLASGDIASGTIDNSTEENSPLFNEYDTQDGNTLRVSVSYGKDAEIPEGAELITSEICQDAEATDTETEYDRYLSEAADALGCDVASIKYARFFDISIVDSTGVEIQPAEGSVVDVSVSLEDEAVKNDALSVVHFGEQADVMETTADAESIRFETTGFSIYAFIETVLEKNVLTSDGYNYEVRAAYDADSGIPMDAELSVEEITDGFSVYGKSYEEYVSGTESALGIPEGTAGYVRLFDISIVNKEDNSIKYQPAEGTGVEVTIELADSISDCLNVVHFPDEAEEGEAVQSSTEDGESGPVVEFLADSFSVYSIVEAPEPVPIYQGVNTLDDIEEGQEYYLSIARSGTNYMTSTTVLNGATSELSGVTNRDYGENWFFEIPEDGKVNIYFLDSEGTKMYLNVDSARNISFSESPQALSIEPTTNAAGTFYIYTVIGNKNYALSVRGSRNFFFEQRNNGVNANERVVLTKYMNDPYDLDGKTFGIAYNDNSSTASAMSANTGSNNNRLAGVDMLIRNDVLDNNGILLVAENSDIQEWTFVSAGEDKYYIKTTVEGAEKYLRINNGNVTLVDDSTSASKIEAIPGTDSNSGKWHFTVGNNSLNYTGASSNNFNAVSNNNATWLNLVERSTLTDDDFVEYSARKISASDDILSATEKDDNGEILTDDEGNPVYRSEKTKVVIYTRVWNETTKKYEFYAVDHDGSLVRVYDSGDQIIWVGNQVNSALWKFTEYTNPDGTPSYYYELENTAYAGTYLAPQSEGIISDQPIGINLNGRREGFDYSSIVAWDDPAYAYSGLKVEQGEDGSLRVVTCSLDEADDFNFAVITPPVEEADPPTTVETVDNDEFGISIKMIDFNNKITGGRDSVQTSYLGSRAWDSAHAYEAETGLVSTNLTDGYPTITAHTEKEGSSLAELFNNMTPANHLFIQSVYNESGYFEYDSTQNFAHYNSEGDEAGNFTVYNQIGAIGTSTGPTRAHGQFMPYNDINEVNGYAHDTQGNVIRNLYDVKGHELPDTDPRKGEPLYSIPQNDADYYYGMELSAVFTQTPDGVDNWGHDIIFEFTGDDDFWFYVDGELVLDLGGVHSAIGGSVNFRTGEVNCNGTTTSLYEVFKSNYRARGLDENEVDELFVTKVVNGETVHVFSDYTTHEMKMFYMERGAGASNLKMRFNLASVKPGTVELSKKLKGIDNTSNKLIQYPYQIWYQTAEYAQNEDGTYVLDENNQRIITSYNEPVLLSQPASNANLTGQVYAVYKGTKKLIPYKNSMKIGGVTYNNVFLLKAGETAVINFPENTYRYKLVECGVDTAVYEHVFINGDQNEIFGKPYNNTDGWDPAGGPETLPSSTTTYDGTTRSDFGITYYTTEGRPSVEYTNEVPPEVMCTVSIEKVLYNTNGVQLTDEEAAQIKDTFTYRLYLGNEFAEQENLLPADMYTYYVKGPDQTYCKWDKAAKKFVSLGVDSFEDFKALSEADQRAGTFTTSMYGAISKIPAGYTVEVRDLIVGTKYKVDEPDREIPKGYTRRDSDGYVRTDLPEGPVVYYTDDEVYGRHPQEGNTVTAEPISDTIADKTESPKIEIRNQEGWGLTAEKEWTDKDFIIHDPIYMAVYLDDGNGNPGDLIDGTVRRLNTGEKEIYWFFPDLKIDGEPQTFDKFIVREVALTDPVVNESTGVVTSYTDITPIDEGGSIGIGGKTFSGTERTENYTVNYTPGESTGQNANIRTDTVKNSRPGIQIYKTDWNGDNYLSGAEFTLKDTNGNDVGYASYTSDRKGLVTTAYLNEGIFYLNEIKTPSGYAVLDEPITIKVTTTPPVSYDLTVTAGSTTYYIALSGPTDFYTTTQATGSDMSRITVKNRTVQELKVLKEGVDGDTRVRLSGVHFALYDQVKDSDGNVRPDYNPKSGYEDLVSNEDGILEGLGMSVGTGTYYLREKAALNGYKKLAEDLCFTIGRDGTVKINNAGYSNWLTRDTSVPGTVSYQITIENTPLGITVRKTDEDGNPLSGSKFELYKRDDTGSFVPVPDYGLGEGGLIDLSDKTELTFVGMANGIYKLTETDPPPCYLILTKNIYFRVSDGAATLTDRDGEPETYSEVVLKDNNSTIMVKNAPGNPLPHTGGPGTAHIYLIGCILTILAGAGIVMMRRRQAV